MKFSTVSLYHSALWSTSYTYRTIIVLLRMIELSFITARFIFFRAPLLIIWTRLPGLRGIKTPYGEMASILGPVRDRAWLLAGETVTGLGSLGECRTKNDVIALQQATKLQVETTNSTLKTILGGLIRGLTIELGSAFIKFGQILSMRPETPCFLREELQLMQDRIPAMAPKDAQRCLQQELKRPLEDVFNYVDWTPIAAASLSQVHRAKLVGGKEVAIKIQRHHLKGTLAIDSAIITNVIVNMVRFLPLLKKMDVSVFTSSFRNSLTREIDFFLEARTQEEFHNLVDQHPIYKQTIKIPYIYWDYTTPQMITMELIKGHVRIDRLLEMDADKLFRYLMFKIPQYPTNHPLHLYRATAAFWGDMILNWGLIHGDPHLGNLYVIEEEEGKWKLFVCDFGMIDELSKDGQQWVMDFFSTLLYFRDPEVLTEVFTRFTSKDESRMAKVDLEQVMAFSKRLLDRRVVGNGCSNEATLRLKWNGTPSVTSEILYELVQIPHLRQPDWLWLVIKSLSYLEELGLTLWGNYDAAAMFTPHIERTLRKDLLRKLQNVNITNAHNVMNEVISMGHIPDVVQNTSAMSNQEIALISSHVKDTTNLSSSVSWVQR